MQALPELSDKGEAAQSDAFKSCFMCSETRILRVLHQCITFLSPSETSVVVLRKVDVMKRAARFLGFPLCLSFTLKPPTPSKFLFIYFPSRF